jgi:hypothetical protein
MRMQCTINVHYTLYSFKHRLKENNTVLFFPLFKDKVKGSYHKQSAKMEQNFESER